MVERITSGKGFSPLNQASGKRKVASQQQTAKSTHSDRVEFSDVLQDITSAGRTEAGAETARSEKLQTLKHQIASGQYRPNLEKVAASLLKVIVAEKS